MASYEKRVQDARKEGQEGGVAVRYWRGMRHV